MIRDLDRTVQWLLQRHAELQLLVAARTDGSLRHEKALGASPLVTCEDFPIARRRNQGRTETTA